MTREERTHLYLASSLDRFKRMQEQQFDRALAEICGGRKQTHWIWYVFPQLEGLGRSATARYFELQDEDEVRRYWEDPYLRGNLCQITEALLRLDKPIGQIVEYPDDLKIRSCMTLFALITGESLFYRVLDKFFGGKPDDYTVRKLNR